MMLMLLALVIASYALFVFTADQMNPLSRPKAPLKRRRWRLARRCAFALLITGALFLLNARYVFVEGWWQLPILLSVPLVVVWSALRRFMKTRQWGETHARQTGTADSQT